METERISSTAARPLMAVSTGKVMNFSTSSGASPGLLVRICTWTLVTSGTASTGSPAIEWIPTAVTSSHPMMTSGRLRREKLTMRSIIAYS